jgi:hypothetical protein
MTRSKADLIAENAMLRQQLIVLNRQIKRPQLTNRDRLRLVLLARCTQFWQQALHIVQPDTLIRWHRDLFRLTGATNHATRTVNLASLRRSLISSNRWRKKTGSSTDEQSSQDNPPTGSVPQIFSGSRVC